MGEAALDGRSGFLKGRQHLRHGFLVARVGHAFAAADVDAVGQCDDDDIGRGLAAARNGEAAGDGPAFGLATASFSMSAAVAADQLSHDRFDTGANRIDTGQAVGFAGFLEVDAGHFIRQVLGVDGDADAGDAPDW